MSDRERGMSTASAKVTVLFLTGLVVSSVGALGQDCLELVGELGDVYAYAVAASGPYAYVGTGETLEVVDVADPSTPEVVGQIEVPSGYG
jgi:hypothetical protein